MTATRRRRLALGFAGLAALVALLGTVYVHALRTLALPWRTVSLGSPVRALAFSPSGDVLAVMGEDATVRVLDPGDGREIARFPAGRENGVSLAFLPDGERLVTSAESSVKLWRWREGKCLRTFPEHTHEMGVVAVSPDGTWIAATGSDTRVRFWTSEGMLMFVSEPNRLTFETAVSSWGFERDDAISCLAISRDGTTVLGGHVCGVVLVQTGSSPGMRSTNQEDLLGPSKERGGIGIVALAASPTSDRFVEGGLRRAFVWSAARGKELDLEDAGSIGLWSVAYSSDGEQIVGADPFGRVRVWESTTGKLVAQSRRGVEPKNPRELAHSVPWPTVVAVSPRGDRLASGDWEGTLRLWWVPTR